MSGGSLGTDDERCEINLGPMIDCVFLLLLYYISVSSLAANRISPKVVLPESHQGLSEKNEQGRFIVDIEWNEAKQEATYKSCGAIFSNPMDLVDVIKINARNAMNKQGFRVVIRADGRTPYEYTQQVMIAVAEAEIPNMLFASVEKNLD